MRADKPIDGKEALLAATVTVVAQKGLRGTTFRNVAAEAGVNNTLISYHFGSRNALLLAAMEWAVQRTANWASTAGVISNPRAFAEDLVRMMAEEPDIQFFQYEMLLESRRTASLKTPVTELYERYIESIREVLEEQRIEHADVRARVVFAALDGLVLQELTLGDETQLKKSVELIANILT